MRKILLFLAALFSQLAFAVNGMDLGELKVFVGYNAGFTLGGKANGTLTDPTTGAAAGSFSVEDKDGQFYHNFVIGARNDYFRGTFEHAPTTRYKAKVSAGGQNLDVDYAMSHSLFTFDYLISVGKNPSFNTKLNVGLVSGTNRLNSTDTGTLLGGQFGLIQELKTIDLTFNIRYLDQIASSNTLINNTSNVQDYSSWQILFGLNYIF